MSLKTNAEKIKAGYIDACNAVLARGGTVPIGMPIGDLDEAIKDIPRDQVLAYYKQVNSEQVITVPQNTEPYARMEKIGGMTYKTENLIPFPYVEATDKTENGMTFNIQDDGGIAVSGTPTDFVEFVVLDERNASRLPSKLTISLQGNCINVALDFAITSNNNILQSDSIIVGESRNIDMSAFSADADRLRCVIKRRITNETVSGVAYPMLNEGSVALPYSQFFTGLRNAAVSEMKSEGANLLNAQAELSVPSDTNSNNMTPRTFVPNTIILGMAHNNYYQPAKVSLVSRTEDSITFTNANGYGLSFYFDLKPNTKYTISCKSSVDNLQTAVLFYNEDGTVDSFGANRVTSMTFTTNQCGKTLIVFVDTASAYGDITEVTLSNIMLNEGTTAQPYRKYVGHLDTLPVPTEVQALDGYGGGVSGYPNEVVFDSKKFVRRTYRKVFDGSEPWSAYSTYQSGIYRVGIANDNLSNPTVIYPPTAISPVISNYYASISADDTYTLIRGIAINLNGGLMIYDEAYTTGNISLWKEHLAELYASGNPLIAEYALETPIETDISAYLTDEFVKVESGGTLTAVNEYNYDMPTEVNYIINTVGG